jgi:hypothetical protein
MLSEGGTEVVMKLLLRTNECLIICVNILIVVKLFALGHVQSRLVKNAAILVQGKLNLAVSFVDYYGLFGIERVVECLHFVVPGGTKTGSGALRIRHRLLVCIGALSALE